MWIVTENWCACRGHCAIDDPVIAATEHTEAAQFLNLFILFAQAQVDALICDAWRDNQWVACVVARF